MMPHRRALLLATTLSAASACGTLLGTDEEDGSPPPVNASVFMSDSALEDTAPSSDGGDVDATACKATGVLVLDNAFGTKQTGLTLSRLVRAQAGDLVTIGRASCSDAGGPRLSLHHLLPEGIVDPTTPCFGDYEVPSSLAPLSTSRVLLASGRISGVALARTRWIALDGGEGPITEQPPGGQGSVAAFSMPLSNGVVWGGYRSSVTGDTPFFGTTASTQNTGEYFPVSAAAEQTFLYVVFTHEVTGAADAVVLRRYSLIGSALTEDVAFSASDVTRLPINAPKSAWVGVGGMRVDNGVVTIAAPGSGAIRVLRYDGKWTQTTVAGYPPAFVERACDGSLILGVNGPARLMRFNGDVAGPELLLGTGTLRGIAQDSADGFVILKQGTSDTLLRVQP